MMKNQLSKREYKYRCKIIAENHLKKECQQLLDKNMRELGISYKLVYLDTYFFYFKILGLNGFLAGKALRELSRALERTRISSKEVAETLNKFSRLGKAELKRMGAWDE